MRQIFWKWAVVLGLSGFFLWSLAAERVVLTIHDIEPGKGLLNLGVSNTAEKFTNNSFVAVQSIGVEGDKARVIFFLEPGVYAIKGYQDGNQNGQFDTDERYGCSTDGTVASLPLSYVSCQIEVFGTTEVEMTLTR